MDIQIDDREASDYPSMVSALKNNGKNNVIVKRLEIGDYYCYPVLIEHKTLGNYDIDVKSSHIFQQAQDMLYNKKINPDLELYIIISGNISDIFKLIRPEIKDGKKIYVPVKVNPKGLIAAWGSLNRQGIHTSFVSNQWFLIEGILSIFSKYNDGKIREYNPIRALISTSDLILNNYQAIKWMTKRKDGTDIMDGIGEVTAKKLKEKFPTPKSLYNATKEQLEEIDGIGTPTAEKLLRFFNGEKLD